MKAALIEETMREVVESMRSFAHAQDDDLTSLRHNGEGARVRSGSTQMVAEPEAEYKAE